jgi:hypothetical protein
LLLATLRESSDPCPPLKGVVGGLAKVLELIEVRFNQLQYSGLSNSSPERKLKVIKKT